MVKIWHQLTEEAPDDALQHSEVLQLPLIFLSPTVNIVPFTKFSLIFVSYIQKTLQYLRLICVLWKDSGIFILFQTKDIQLLKQDLFHALQTFPGK